MGVLVEEAVVRCISIEREFPPPIGVAGFRRRHGRHASKNAQAIADKRVAATFPPVLLVTNTTP